jgi:hypothetical protein
MVPQPHVVHARKLLVWGFVCKGGKKTTPQGKSTKKACHKNF